MPVTGIISRITENLQFHPCFWMDRICQNGSDLGHLGVLLGSLEICGGIRIWKGLRFTDAQLVFILSYPCASTII